MNAGPVMVECPRHAGAFDCSPFCELCSGENELPEHAWREWFRPDTFRCGDDYHECNHDDDDEHATYLMFYFPRPEDYFPDEDELETIETAAAQSRVWSLTGNTITAGRDTSAEWLFITQKTTNA